MDAVVSVVIALNFREDAVDGQTDGFEADGQGADNSGLRFRPDDVLELECPFTETAVTEISRFHVSVRPRPTTGRSSALNQWGPR
jgi:hypothetical protein